MANALYDKGREAFLTGDIHWDTDNIKCTLVDTDDYSVTIGTDNAYDDVTAAGRVAASGNFATKTVTDGVADAADVTLSSVSGDQSEAIVIWLDSGVESTSTLIAYIDTATGFPITPSGGDITIRWSDGADKIFKL